MKNTKITIYLLISLLFSGCVTADKTTTTKDSSTSVSNVKDLYGIWTNSHQDKDGGIIIASKLLPDNTGVGLMFFREKGSCMKTTTNFLWDFDKKTGIYTQIDQQSIEETTGKKDKNITNTERLQAKVRAYKLGSLVIALKFISINNKSPNFTYKKSPNDSVFNVLTKKDVETCR